jgi:hypothetical protein
MKTLKVRKKDNCVVVVDRVEGFVVSEEIYLDKGRSVQVNPHTNLLEVLDPLEKELDFIRGRGYVSRHKRAPLKTPEGRSVLFHPDKLEFAEVEVNHSGTGYKKIKQFQQ